MLKKRIIPTLLLCDGRMVKGKQFKDYRDTGEPKTAIRIYSAQDADELVFLNIEGGKVGRSSLLEVLYVAAQECFMPLAAGGGIESLDDVRELLLAGADKVVINTSTVTNPLLIKEASERFGSQCIVAGIDYRTCGNTSRVWIHSGSESTEIEPMAHAQYLASLGAGEILLSSIDRDGMMGGYDIKMIDAISKNIHIPVIASGGAGNFMHLADLFNQTSASAAACSSLFHFGDNNPIRARSYVKNLGVPMRILK